MASDGWRFSRLRAPVMAGALMAALLATACSPQGSAGDPAATPAPQGAARVHPESGLELIDVTVITADARHTFTTELAASPEAQARGLMFRTELGDDEGMLFPSGTPQARSFWMKNTPLPLDLIFIGPDRRIANIGKGEPYLTDSILSDGPVLAVFEIRGGRSEELGIAPGDLVEWELPE